MANHSFPILGKKEEETLRTANQGRISIHSLSHSFQNLDGIARSFYATVEPIDGVVRYKRERGQTLCFRQKTDAGCWVAHRFENFNQRRRWTYFRFSQEWLLVIFGGSHQTSCFRIQWQGRRFSGLRYFSRSIHNFAARSVDERNPSINIHSICRRMDRSNRGEAVILNGQLTLEFHDEYEHQSDDIEYVVENVLQNTNTDSPSFEILRTEFNLVYGNTCSCSSGTDGVSSFEMCTKCHGGNYVCIQTEDEGRMELVLNENRKSRDLLYECSDLCPCPSTCQNRLVQFGPRMHLQIAQFPRKQLGLITSKSIPSGAFICEYAGEVLTKNEALRRIERIDAANEMNYLICLNERSMDATNKIETFVDPSRLGNIGRYLNHSCEPNCEIISVRTNSSIPKLGENAQVSCPFWILALTATPWFQLFSPDGKSTPTRNCVSIMAKVNHHWIRTLLPTIENHVTAGVFDAENICQILA